MYKTPPGGEGGLLPAQGLIDQTPKKDILVVQGDWNDKVGKAVQAVWGAV